MFFIYMIFGASSCKCRGVDNCASKETNFIVNGHEIHLYEIDGCEYIGYIGGSNTASSRYLTHKGNCKFCQTLKTKN